MTEREREWQAAIYEREFAEQEEQIKALEKEIRQTERDICYRRGYAEGKRDAMKWISVEERLPPLDENVLVLVKGDCRYIWCLTRLDPTTADVVWEDDDGRCEEMVSDVTHWMPLPDLPEVEE